MAYKACNSGWVAGTDYRTVGNGVGFLAVYLRDGRALLHVVPSWVRGLLHAGAVKVPKGASLVEVLITDPERSTGRAYNRLVKGRYAYQRIEPTRVDELRGLMAA